MTNVYIIGAIIVAIGVVSLVRKYNIKNGSEIANTVHKTTDLVHDVLNLLNVNGAVVNKVSDILDVADFAASHLASVIDSTDDEKSDVIHNVLDEVFIKLGVDVSEHKQLIKVVVDEAIKFLNK